MLYRQSVPGLEPRFARVAQAAARAGDVWTQTAALTRQGDVAIQNGDDARGTALIYRALATAEGGARPARPRGAHSCRSTCSRTCCRKPAAQTMPTRRLRVSNAPPARSAPHRYAGMAAFGQGNLALDRGDMAAAARDLRRAQAEAEVEGDAAWHIYLGGRAGTPRCPDGPPRPGRRPSEASRRPARRGGTPR